MKVSKSPLFIDSGTQIFDGEVFKKSMLFIDNLAQNKESNILTIVSVDWTEPAFLYLIRCLSTKSKYYFHTVIRLASVLSYIDALCLITKLMIVYRKVAWNLIKGTSTANYICWFSLLLWSTRYSLLITFSYKELVTSSN
jgi:hypothetical protein